MVLGTRTLLVLTLEFQGDELYLLLRSGGILKLELALSLGMKWTTGAPPVCVTPLGDVLIMPRAVLLP